MEIYRSDTMSSATGKKKRKKGPIIAGSIVAVLVVVIAVFALTRNVGAQVAAASSSLMSSAARTGSISNTVVGTGNLESEKAGEVKLPAGLVIDEVLVEKGGRVNEGDALAVINAKSITDLIAQVRSQIETLDASIEKVKDDTEETTIKSNVSGRVKAIYAAEGEDVVNRMMESGALMLLSLDGYMAVDVPASGLAAGDSVTVTLSDGTKKTGEVDSVIGDTCTVTLTDNGPELDDNVTVTDADGNTIGTGALYVHQPLTVVGTYGTVDTVHVSEDTKVSSGTKLFTLTDVAASQEYQEYVDEREELSDTLQTLFALSKTNVLTAPYSGTVASVSITEDGTVSATNIASDDTDSSNSSNDIDYSSYLGLAADDSAAQVTLLAGESETTTITELKDLPLTAPTAGAVPQTVITAETYTGEVWWYPADSAFAAGTSYAAGVTLTAKAGYTFASDIAPAFPGHDDYTVGNVEVTDNGGKLSFNVMFPATGAGGGNGGGGETPTIPDYGSSYPSGSYSGYSGYSGSYSGYGGSDTASSLSDSSTSSVTVGAETEALTISPDEYMHLTVSVDELDILSLELGQTAAVTLDALENEVFSGSITKINYSASSSGGVTKYTVEVTIPKTDAMLAGMSASVTITIEEHANILVIPVDALQEMFGRTFVYTEQDADGSLTGEKDVETGISDGSFVEITSGLNEGDTVWYILNVSNDSFMNGNFMMGGMGSTSRGSGEVTIIEGGPSGGNATSSGGGSFPGGN